MIRLKFFEKVVEVLGLYRLLQIRVDSQLVKLRFPAIWNNAYSFETLQVLGLVFGLQR